MHLNNSEASPFMNVRNYFLSGDVRCLNSLSHTNLSTHGSWGAWIYTHSHWGLTLIQPHYSLALCRYRSLLSHYPYDFKMHLYNSGVSLLMNARNFSFLCDVGCHNSSSYTSLIAALNDGSRVVWVHMLSNWGLNLIPSTKPIG